MKRGHCLCGAVSFEYEGPENWRGHCHCESCRRNTGSPFTTFFGVPISAFRYSGQAPQVYRSSFGVRRSFCGRCGTPIAYQSDDYPEEIHFYAAALEDSYNFQPDFHVHYAEKVRWVELSDSLPKYLHGSDGEDPL
ncbi:MAG: GFA family protein [Kiloniellales bacterium]